eukprot:Nitzschia sp. Nitz4//scaffold78_size91513//38031//39232//NITZ4_004924-RA/size91513-snap-gene-0.138-mRNA-1//-1//CDS//3329558115//8907//frame0
MPLQWSTRFTKAFPCRLPIMGAPMFGVSNPELAVETSRAGGLGFLAAGHLVSESSYSDLVKSIDKFHSLSAAAGGEFPLCIGFISHSTFSCETGWELYERVLKTYKPQVVQLFAGSVRANGMRGDTTDAVALAHDYGSKVVMQTGTVSDAQEAFDLGADCICAQGSDAGGHGVLRELGSGTLSITGKIVEMGAQQQKDIPILAAGGISDGKDLAAVLSLGADGCVLGTRLYASNESTGAPEFKQALVSAESGDATVRTEAFDLLWNSYKAVVWPHKFASSGALRNRITDEWDTNHSGLASALASDRDSLVDPFKQATTEADTTLACVYSGKGVGKISTIDSACNIITKVEEDAEKALRSVQSVVQSVGPSKM